MTNVRNLALVEEFFLLMQRPGEAESEATLISATIDLSEFDLTEAELQKLRRVTCRLELSLLTEFCKHFEAASVLIEVRSD
ncbi:hypothetical protein [Phormidesmis priestleyi]